MPPPFTSALSHALLCPAQEAGEGGELPEEYWVRVFVLG